MNVTQHGKHWFKGVSLFKSARGKALVFFGISRGHVLRKETEWVLANIEPLNQAQKARPALRVIEGGRV